MICALSPASSNYEETLSTLRYADRAKKNLGCTIRAKSTSMAALNCWKPPRIKNKAVVNENPQEWLFGTCRLGCWTRYALWDGSCQQSCVVVWSPKYHAAWSPGKADARALGGLSCKFCRWTKLSMHPLANKHKAPEAWSESATPPRWPHFNIQCENRDSFPKDSQYYCVIHLHAIVYLCHTFFCEEENQKLKEMIQSLGAGRTVDAQTFEDLGRKSGNPEHQTRLQAWNATLQKWTISDDGNRSCSSISQHVVVVNNGTFYSWLNIWIDMDSWSHRFWLLAGREKSQRRRLHWRPWNVL